jgi:hypothetical protein
MRAVVFLVYLCFFLLGKNDHVAAAMQRAGYTTTQASQSFSKTRLPLAINTEHILIAEDTNPDNEKEYLAGDEAEDEDTDSAFSKSKLKSLHYFAFFRLFLSDHSFKRFNALASIQGQSSPKYITQRVLRI